MALGMMHKALIPVSVLCLLATAAGSAIWASNAVAGFGETIAVTTYLTGALIGKSLLIAGATMLGVEIKIAAYNNIKPTKSCKPLI